MLFMLCTLLGGKMGLMKNKKGHFDLETIVITAIGGAVAYAIAQKHILRHIYKSKHKSKNEKALHIRQ